MSLIDSPTSPQLRHKMVEPESPSPIARHIYPALKSDDESEDEESLLLQLRLQKAEVARILAEEKQLKLELKLKALREKRHGEDTSISPGKGLTTTVKASQRTRDLSESSVITPEKRTRVEVMQALSPEQRKVIDQEIIKRRKIDAPGIRNTLISATLRSPVKSLQKQNGVTVLVAHTPSPKKPPLARVALGLDNGRTADDVNLTRRKKTTTVPTSTVSVGPSNETHSSLRPPTMSLKSTQLAIAEKVNQSRMDSRKGTVYEGILKAKIDKQQSRNEAAAGGSTFAERLVANREKRKVMREVAGKTVRKTDVKSNSNIEKNLENKLQEEKAQQARERRLEGERRKAELKQSKRNFDAEFTRPRPLRVQTAKPAALHDSDDDLEIDSPTKAPVVSERLVEVLVTSELEATTDTDKTSSTTGFSDPYATHSTTPPTSPPIRPQSELTGKLSGIATDLWDPVMKLELITRYMSVSNTDMNMENRETMNISGACAIITPPEYDVPAIPDWAVFGIVAKKSQIMYSKPPQYQKKSVGDKPLDSHKVIAEAVASTTESRQEINAAKLKKIKEKAEERKKEAENAQKRRYFIMTLTDLNQELELYIMGPLVDQLWPVRLGTIIAVCNPGVWKDKKEGRNGFKLNMVEPDDEVFEIGLARDFGLCRSLTRQDTPCTNWVDTRKTEYCDFHVEMAVRKTSNRRAETNKGVTLFSPKKNGKRLVLTGKAGGKRGLLPDPLEPRNDHHGGGGKMYVLERFKGTTDGFDAPMKTNRW
ncbi:hypothetical protein V1512DRAFT_268610 [Lipomyces arxii]|uniref:uncharacterized protein n=1 Tax=Lipomyces arxii TaxID=56418 RepID=UPI0034CEA2AB